MHNFIFIYEKPSLPAPGRISDSPYQISYIQWSKIISREHLWSKLCKIFTQVAPHTKTTPRGMLFCCFREVLTNHLSRQTIAANQAVELLPPLPRGWSRVCHETGLFFRAIGLGVVVTAFQVIFTKNISEPEKVAIRQIRITALLRTLIHAVPVAVVIFEIVLGLKGHFVRATFDKQNYLQFAAKEHEIAMQALIATILLSCIR